MTNNKIHVIGLGAEGIDSLPSSHKKLILSADIIYGAERHLEEIPTNIKKKNMVKKYKG